MKLLIKRLLLAVAPEWTTELLSARARAHSHRMVKQWGLNSLTECLLTKLGPEVQSGPFEGLTLTPMTYREHLGPFLLGTYESELHSWFAAISGRRFAQVLDVGASFGYYAVGLARLFPEIPVIAFDTDHWARSACREMAAENRTPNVEVTSYCSPLWLDQGLQPNGLIICDCEGYEGTLLAESTTPALDSATLIVETHDHLVAGVTGGIRQRFAGTHQIAMVSTDSGSDRKLPVDLSFLAADMVQSALREVRGNQEWLFLTPMPSGRE